MSQVTHTIMKASRPGAPYITRRNDQYVLSVTMSFYSLPPDVSLISDVLNDLQTRSERS